MNEKKLGMLIDLSLCIGCNACTVACKRENDVPLGAFNTWIESFDVERPDGRIARANVPKQCNHCADAPCVKVCPTGASYRAEDGTVQIDQDRCIGCKYCMAACPYQVRVHNEKTGTVDKCRFCTVSAETSGTKMCSCVEACLTGARIFGDLDDPASDISKEIAATNAQPIAGDLTKSKVFYVR